MSESEAFETCPTDVAHAPVERVWQRLTDPSLLGWVDAKVVDAPARHLGVGDRVRFVASFRLPVTWSVLAIDPPRQIALDIQLPFGMAVQETIVLSRIDADSCRITFN